jgi:hypothetical protein
MEKLFDVILVGTDCIIGYPERAIAASLFFVGVIGISRYFGLGKKDIRVLYIPTIAWLIFAFMEWKANREGAYIRLDLVLTWPLIWLATFVSVGYWFRLVWRSVKDKR